MRELRRCLGGRRSRRHRRFGRFRFSEQTARYAQRSFGLLHINRFGQNQVGTDPKCLRHAGLSFDQRNRKRILIGPRITGALEQQGGVLLIVAIDDNRVEVFGHQPLDRCKGFVAGLDAKLKFTQDLGDHMGRPLVWTEQ